MLTALLALSLAAEPASLGIGSKAPAITVEDWLKGDPVKGFEAGKVYVVEFWATWCGPCIQSIPHLTQIQKDHPGVAVMGIAASERKKRDGADTRLAGLKTFLEKRGDAMGYRVAFDEDRSMGTSWMDAAGQEGIPCAFIVGKDGAIDWVGHPMEMDQPLAAVLAGSWDRAKAKRDAEARAAEERFMQEEMPALAKAAQASGDWQPVAARLEELASKSPNPTQMRMVKFQVLAEAGDAAGACATARQLLDADIGPSGLNMLAWTIATELEGKERDLKVALAAADKAVAQSKGDPEILDTQARVHFEMGDAAKAREIQRRAVAEAEKQGTTGENLDQMKEALKRYEAAASGRS
jgi:thiol-disulfide isomerase/thioredoxin